MSPSLYSEIAGLAAQRGLNLVGLVAAERFDRSQPAGRRVRDLAPECGTVCVLGSGGDSHWRALRQESPGVPRLRPRPGFNPLQEHAAATAGSILELLATQQVTGRAVLAEDRDAPNMVQLGECAGLGTISPVLGVLLHPEYGPWLSLRLALLLDGMPFGPLRDAELQDAFQPCRNCDQPCVRACPSLAFDGRGGYAPEACAHWRHRGGCGGGCDSRRACPLGAEYRYGPAEEAFRHDYSLHMLRRYYGLGAWRFVPRRLRQR